MGRSPCSRSTRWSGSGPGREASTLSEEARSPLASFLALRTKLEAGGWFPDADLRMGEELTSAIVSIAGEVPRRTAVVATGGFGRGSLALRSDVDLMILAGGRPDPGFVSRLLRPLWDAGLRVGHSVRSPSEARSFAGSHLDGFCALLTARLLAGDPEVFADFADRLGSLARRESGRVLAAVEGEERRRREAEPYRLMTLDLKRGRGGQRTLDAVEWADRLTGREGLVESERHRSLREILVSARSGLHALTRRAHDSYDFELREPLARWLGSEVVELGTRLLEATREVERLAAGRWPGLDRVRIPATRRAPRDGILIASLQAGRSGTLDTLDNLLSSRTLPTVWGHEDRLAFLDLTRAEANPVLRRLVESRWMGEVLGEWAGLVDVPHVVPFHRFTVMDHSLAAVAEMRRLLARETDVALACEVSQAIDDPEPLLWAALLHDIGKRFEGDHCRRGAALAEAVTLRLGIPRSDLVVWLVDNHLLLADAATRFDLDDQLHLDRVVEQIGGLSRLRHLYLLTVADSRATGTDTWSAWRAELLRRAFRRLEAELTRRAAPDDAGEAQVVDQVLAAGGSSLRKREVESHLAGFGEIYRSMHTPDLIACHARLGLIPVEKGGLRLDAHIGEATTRLVVVTRDRPGLLATLAGVFAIERLSILDARVATRSDGLAFDSFELTDAVTGGAVDAARLGKLEDRLRRVLRGGFGLRGALSAKQRDYRHREQPGIEPVVRIMREPGGGGIVEIVSSDRLGLLFDIAEVFVRFAMPIVRAKVDTRAGVAYDTFWVERVPGATGDLEQALLDRLR